MTRMTGLRTNVRALFVVPAVATTMLWSPSAGAEASSQLVHADQALYAEATVEVPFPDGSVRLFQVTFTAPQGTVTGTDGMDGLDLRQPFAAVTQTNRTTWTQVCSQASNPATWTAGAVPAGDDGWTGTSVDVTCDDGSGFAFYRIGWESGSYTLITNQVTAAYAGGLVAPWSADTAQGSIELRPTANQQSVVRVCGHRADGTVDCFGDATGFGAVMPEADALVVHGVTG